MKAIKFLTHIILIILLTAITQIGGVIYLISLIIKPYLINRTRLNKKIVFSGVFIIMYFLFSVLIIPPVAKSYGREALPVFSNKNLKPLNIMTCILNRHYVRPELKENIKSVAKKMNKKYPNTILSYLDANFPFYNGFPLLPHLSHNDGKKLDIAFFYKDKSDNELNKKTPSFMGYGVFEEPKKGEYNAPKNCKDKGFWQYSILENFVPQWKKEDMVFDSKRTKSMVQFMLQEKNTGKIFIEPHLKTRMGLQNNKIRFHGCRAVRHDDHVHLQIR
ncbi:hypothetical protein [Tenacibaculum halocynthiae]|uniref:hypothetical protein n=1 Tax=Tenacibaculum halocynthiae TaxID=1254437 RepID=UPI003D654509